MKPSLVFAVICLAAGCGEDVDLTGLYQVTHHTQSDSNCETEGASVDQPPYFQMEKYDIFGYDAFGYRECDSVDQFSRDECTSVAYFPPLTQSIDNGWKGWMTTSSGTMECNLSYSEGKAVLQGGDEVRVELRVWGEEVTVSEDECDPDLAEDRGKSMPCMDFQVVVGSALETGE